MTYDSFYDFLRSKLVMCPVCGTLAMRGDLNKNCSLGEDCSPKLKIPSNEELHAQWQECIQEEQVTTNG